MITDAKDMYTNMIHPEDGSVRKNSFAEIKSKSEPVTPIQGIQGSYEQTKQNTNKASENTQAPSFVPSTYTYPYPYPGTPSYPHGYHYPPYPMGYPHAFNPYYYYPPPPNIYFPPPPTPVQSHGTPLQPNGPTLHDTDEHSVPSYSSNPISTVTLHQVSDPSEFPDFLQNFQKYLNDINLSKIFLNTAQSTITDQEKQHVTHIFRLYVDPKAYPMWFKNELSDNYVSLFDLIQCAIIKYNKRNTPTKLYQQLQHIRYDAKYDPMLFKKRINNMIQQAKDYNITIPDRILCDTIIQSLHGPYQIIVDNYNRNFHNITLNDILNDIINIHSRQPHPYPIKHHSNTSSSTKPTNQPKKPKNKKKISNIHCEHPIEENTQDDSPENLKDYLVLDTGAEISVINDIEFLNHITDANVVLYAANDKPIPAAASGIISLKFQTHSKPYVIRAIHAPDISNNFISTYQLEKVGIVVDTRHRQLLDKSEHILSPIINVGKYMCIPRSILQPSNQQSTSYSINKLGIKLTVPFLHNLFGHINVHDIKTTIDRNMISGITSADVDWSGIHSFQCTSCMKGKSTRHKHIIGSRIKYQKEYAPFEYIHTDVFGPMSHLPVGTPSYFISFTDESTRFRWVFPLYSKDSQNVTRIFSKFINMVSNQFKTNILSFQMDRGSEFTNDQITKLLEDKGINPIYTTAGDSRANGVAERFNLTFLNDCRTLLQATNLPNSTWFYAVQFATLMRNAFFNSSIKTSSRAKAGLAGLDVSTILPFGQEVIIHKGSTTSKLSPRGDDGLALCPSTVSHGYLIYNTITKKVVDTSNYSIVKSSPSKGTTPKSTVFDTLIAIHDYPENIEPKYEPDKIDIPTENQSPSHTTALPSVQHSFENNDTLEEVDNLIDSIIHTNSNYESDDYTSENESDNENEAISSTSPIQAQPIEHTSLGGTNLSNSSNLSPDSTSFANPQKDAVLGGKNTDAKITKPSSKKNTDASRLAKKAEEYLTKFSKEYKISNIRANQRSNELNSASHSINYRDAIIKNTNNDSKYLYKLAYEKEIEQLKKMNTWDEKLIDDKNIDKKKIINTMFIFNTKRDGTHKCRLVARGDQQKKGTYNEEATSNTVHHYALMTVLSNALNKNKYITQLDISSAYLYADLEEELYIRAPPHMNLKKKVVRLKKSLYGLKQSGANWYREISNFLTSKCCLKEISGWSCVFINKKITVCLFVDDMIITSRKISDAENFISKLQEKFDTKVINLGVPTEGKTEYDILGLEVTYMFDKELSFGMEKSLKEKLPLLDVPLNKNGKLLKAPGPPGKYIEEDYVSISGLEYKKQVKWLQKIVGLASYVAHKYRYDILYYVNVIASNTLFPNKEVKELARLLVQYLWDTKEKKLIWYKKKNNENQIMLNAIADASFAKQKEFKSQLGYYIKIDDNIIAGKSTKSKTTLTSTAEAEIGAIGLSIPVLKHIKLLLKELSTDKIITTIETDSQPAMAVITSKEDKSFKNKFFGIKALRIRDEISENNLRVARIDTANNIADILTKPVTYKRYSKLTSEWIV